MTYIFKGAYAEALMIQHHKLRAQVSFANCRLRLGWGKWRLQSVLRVCSGGF